MPTFDEILDGLNPAQEKGSSRRAIQVPEKLLEQWLGEPRFLIHLENLFLERLNDCRGDWYLQSLTSDILERKFPSIIEHAWDEAKNLGWVVDEIPPYEIKQDPIDPTMVNFIWKGPYVWVNIPDEED